VISEREDHVQVERPAAEIAIVRLNRPQTLNALTPQLCRDLISTFDDLDDDASTRVVILTGAGRGFCSGHDLAALDPRQQRRSTPEFLEHQQLYAALVRRVTTMSSPVIAAVNGAAAGGGLALALASDVRICSTTARFNAAFVRLGVSGCDVGVSYLLPRIVGPTVAFEMMLTGRLIDADEAQRCGLVLRVHPADELLDAALEIARQIAVNSPFGVRQTKRVMWTNLDAPSLAAAIELENRTQALCVTTADFEEAVTAFVDKRSPKFRNA
jgi:enoyl-CoA hydratase